ncbi:anti-sigma factor [Enterovirga rhinocerotis]|uniref:Anti-sigma-K factor RskA n=1 Tax=Enterovirga rhinocerotis TaxID=1339210 RepID=A0A4R7BR42_9HYPH|nr:anti-sigma factor [Enterovirga rhinocerotis]TDR87242.1 anti-sigma-K factor RskA [Enterovirga rhinocerotis]
MSPTAPTPPDDESDLDAGLYVFGLLDEVDTARAAEREVHDPAFAAAVAHWRERMAELDATAEPVPADDALWQRIEDAIAAPAAAQAADRRSVLRAGKSGWLAGFWQSLPVWRTATFAAASAALAIGLVTATRQPSPIMVAVLLTDTHRAAAVVDIFADGRARLLPLESIAVPDDRSLQVWTLWDRAHGPVSLGILDRARQIRLPVENLPRTIPNQLFEITLEPKAGSPTGRPTGPILMKGTTSPTL